MTTGPGPEAEWRRALAEGRLLIQRGVDGAAIFPPRLTSPGDSNSTSNWVEVSGLGTVYSVTVISPRLPEPPYNVVLVDLDEGVRMMSRVDGIDPHDVRIGMRVQARVAQQEGEAIVLFAPLETTDGR
jgi:hypothetical protein